MASTVIACPACSVRKRVADDAAGRPRCSSCHADLPWLIDAGGAEIARQVGALPSDAIGRWVDAALAGITPT